MDETRRNFIKGMLASGTFLASGISGVAQVASAESFFSSERNCRLLLGNTAAAESFVKGAQSAYSGCGGHHYSALPIFQFENGRSTHFLHLADLLMQSRNTRWIAVMDHADAAIFAELVRNFAGRMLASGVHASMSDDHAALPLRHVWATASPTYSAGGALASMLAQNQYSFSIIERFLARAEGENTISDASFPEFLSYHLADQPTAHLYCAGVSPPEASRLLDWEISKDQESSFSRAIALTADRNRMASSATIEYPQSSNWVEATGYAIAAAALGMRINRESCSERAFVYRSDQRYRNREALLGMHFVSFVIDV
ncbi:hypothetical protein ABO04_08550 [Nitrosomonas sp. HPC101]|uniref:hypothetical protein n=1 Tax=Nitrosomonas sp. HPC101 TaxID=1658667 RepID=UPI00136D7A2A|nr:hypothetical protein [Nitrosomonas sp. HPC101]MXS85956.1 hypothetical protein [Nitrosomonas sp. HPC101]